MSDEKKLENNFQRFDKLVRELENEELDIEKSLNKFKEGVGLIKECQRQIEEAKNEFIQLNKELEREK